MMQGPTLFSSCVPPRQEMSSTALILDHSQMQQAQNAFSGVAFHCYGGNVQDQDQFHNAFPDKEIYFTECTGTVGSDWWNDIQVCHNTVSRGKN